MKRPLKLRIPDTVEDVSVGKDADVQIGLDNVVKVTLLFISKKRIWHPDSPGIRQGEILESTCVRKKCWYWREGQC